MSAQTVEQVIALIENATVSITSGGSPDDAVQMLQQAVQMLGTLTFGPPQAQAPQAPRAPAQGAGQQRQSATTMSVHDVALAIFVASQGQSNAPPASHAYEQADHFATERAKRMLKRNG